MRELGMGARHKGTKWGEGITTDFTERHGWISILIVIVILILILIEKSTTWRRN